VIWALVAVAIIGIVGFAVVIAWIADIEKRIERLEKARSGIDQSDPKMKDIGGEGMWKP
jgi:hypothetical protein